MRASKPHSSDKLAPGQRIGPFVLLAPMGVGGSGRIWAVARVGQLGFAKRMVLKVMRHDKVSSARARERFDREACLGGRLSHANLRAVHDLGSHEGRPFMALSWVDTSLSELLEHAPARALEPDVVCWIGMQCCAALGAAHGYVDHGGEPRPIVHRDVSPGNILLTADGHALLADLTAPAAEAAASPRADARFFGSLGYAAPEALRQEPLDPRADLFSLGAVLYEALAGAPAFEGDDEHSVMFQILEGAPVELARRVPGIAADLAAVVQRCLERQLPLRFQSAAELRAALSACCRERSAFRLEQRTAAVVREVLGTRIREREEAMHLAFQRFAPSPFERTDTLPIAAAGGAGGSPGLPVSTAGARRELPSETSRSGAGVAISTLEPKRRGALWIAALFLASLALFALWTRIEHPAMAPAAGDVPPGGDAPARGVPPAVGDAPPAADEAPPAVGDRRRTPTGDGLLAPESEGAPLRGGAGTRPGVGGSDAAGDHPSPPAAQETPPVDAGAPVDPGGLAKSPSAPPSAAPRASSATPESVRGTRPAPRSAPERESPAREPSARESPAAPALPAARGKPADGSRNPQRAPSRSGAGPSPGLVIHYDLDNPYAGGEAAPEKRPAAPEAR